MTEEITWDHSFMVDVSYQGDIAPPELELMHKEEPICKPSGGTVYVKTIENEAISIHTNVYSVSAKDISEFLFKITKYASVLTIDAVLKIPYGAGKQVLVLYISPDKQLRILPEKVKKYKDNIPLFSLDELNLTIYQGLTYKYG